MLGNQVVMLVSDGGWFIEKNIIIINYDGVLMLVVGDIVELQCYLVVMQMLVVISDLNVMLVYDFVCQGKVCVYFFVMMQIVVFKLVIELLFFVGEIWCFVGEWGEVLIIGDFSVGMYWFIVLVLVNDEM